MDIAIHLPEAVAQTRDFYGELLHQQASFTTIADHLRALSIRMWEGVQEGNEVVFREIANYHKDHLGRELKVLMKAAWTEGDCQLTIAHEYGFGSWGEVCSLEKGYDLGFEQTVDALLAGDIDLLCENIGRMPQLAQQRSRYGHGATLLHYAVSNGVELWRQQVPLNLPEMVRYLLNNGADLRAKMNVYGGTYAAPELLLSSLHPRNAGIFAEMRAIMDT